MFIKRCRDTANDQRRFVIALDDDDLTLLVEARRENDRATYQLLMQRFEQLVMSATVGNAYIHLYARTGLSFARRMTRRSTARGREQSRPGRGRCRHRRGEYGGRSPRRSAWR